MRGRALIAAVCCAGCYHATGAGGRRCLYDDDAYGGHVVGVAVLVAGALLFTESALFLSSDDRNRALDATGLAVGAAYAMTGGYLRWRPTCVGPQ